MMKQKQLVKNIKVLMVQKEIQQQLLAEKAGFSAKMFSDMMNNRRIIYGDDILHIAEALGVTPNELFGVTQ